MSELFDYDPEKRLTAKQALHHEYFKCNDENSEHNGKIWVTNDCFDGLEDVYPARRVSHESNDLGTGGLGTKRGLGGLSGAGDVLGSAAKRR